MRRTPSPAGSGAGDAFLDGQPAIARVLGITYERPISDDRG